MVKSQKACNIMFTIIGINADQLPHVFSVLHTTG